jgi:hypothetical protein
MAKEVMTQEKFNELYVEFVDNYQEKYRLLDLNFDMVMKMHGMKKKEFDEKIAYLTDNPTDKMIEKWSAPTVEIEEKIKLDNDLDDEGERLHDDGEYQYGDLQKAVNNYLTDEDDAYEDFVDERPEPKKEWWENRDDDSNEY